MIQRSSLHLLVFLISLLTCSILNAQIKFDPALLDNPKKNGVEVADQLNRIELHEYSPEAGHRIYLKNGLRSHKFINESDWLTIQDTVEAYRIDIVYSKYPLRKGKYHEIYPLLFNRIKATISMDEALNSDQIEWNKILQTNCTSDDQVNSLFHGVVIWYRTNSELYPTPPPAKPNKFIPIKVEQERLISEQMSIEQIESNVDFMLSSPNIPDSLKESLSDKTVDEKIAHLKKFYEERLEKAEDIDLYNLDPIAYGALKTEIEAFSSKFGHGDPIVLNVLDRHPEWKNMLVINDWTGSMYPYGAQVLEWHLLNFEHSGIKTITLFNDGNFKTGNQKEIGETGGIYTEKADNIPQLLDLFNYVMLRGGGGEVQENDIEAILEAIEDKPDFSELVLIADNNACVRDIELADRIGVPVRIILCGYTKSRGVNKHYAYLAKVTGGGIYTIDEDIEDIKIKLSKSGDVASIPDTRLKLSSNKCRDRSMRIRSRKTSYTLRTGRLKKRKVITLDAAHYELDEVPNWVFKCYSLNDLNLSNNNLLKLSGRISYLKFLSKINLSHNELEELPRSFARIKYLTRINLSHNEIEDFPEQIKYMKHLQELDLSNNKLVKFGSLKTRYLKKLNLANNNLESIPASIRRHRALNYLNLSGNALTEIPENLPSNGSLNALSTLDLSNNNISSLPEDLSPLLRLDELNMSGNPLSESDKKRLKDELIHTKVIL